MDTCFRCETFPLVWCALNEEGTAPQGNDPPGMGEPDECWRYFLTLTSAQRRTITVPVDARFCCQGTPHPLLLVVWLGLICSMRSSSDARGQGFDSSSGRVAQQRFERRCQHVLDIGAAAFIGPSRAIGAVRAVRRKAAVKVVVSQWPRGIGARQRLPRFARP